MLKYLARLALLGVATLSTTYATTISNGQSIAAPTIAAPVGTLEAQLTNQTITFAPTGNPLSATFSEWVYLDSTTGDLDFVYQFTNTTNPSQLTAQYQGVITDVTMASFATYTTNVGYEAGTGTPASTVPDTVKRSADVIDFSFGTASTFGPGDVSPILVVDTNATTFDIGTVGVIGGVGGDGVGKGPSLNTAPEPLSMSLMGAGLFMFGLFRWRKSRA